MKARDYFKTQGKNFMTPEIIRYIDSDRYLIELSRGTGFDHEPIYGVTVATITGRPLFDESQMFHSLEEAEGYIAGLTA